MEQCGPLIHMYMHTYHRHVHWSRLKMRRRYSCYMSFWPMPAKYTLMFFLSCEWFHHTCIRPCTCMYVYTVYTIVHWRKQPYNSGTLLYSKFFSQKEVYITSPINLDNGGWMVYYVHVHCSIVPWDVCTCTYYSLLCFLPSVDTMCWCSI